MTQSMRELLAAVARKIRDAPQPPGVTVVCHYDSAVSRSSLCALAHEAARGRRVTTHVYYPDNNRMRPPRLLPRFTVIDPGGPGWEWSPPDAKLSARAEADYGGA